MSKNEHGEGNYKATQDYNKRTKDYLESADVQRDARDAAPANEREAKELREAEEQGRQHAKLKEHECDLKPSKSSDQ